MGAVAVREGRVRERNKPCCVEYFAGAMLGF